MAQHNTAFVNHYSEAELRAIVENDNAIAGGTHPTTVAATIAVSAAFCPTTKCSKHCH